MSIWRVQSIYFDKCITKLFSKHWNLPKTFANHAWINDFRHPVHWLQKGTPLHSKCFIYTSSIIYLQETTWGLHFWTTHRTGDLVALHPKQTFAPHNWRNHGAVSIISSKAFGETKGWSFTTTPQVVVENGSIHPWKGTSNLKAFLKPF